MLLCDIIFPQNLSYLTYIVPEELKERIRPGQIVQAPIRGRIKSGVVFRIHSDVAEGMGSLRSIDDIILDKPFFSEKLLSLINWAADYYSTNHGLVLKATPFKDFVRKRRKGQLHLPSGTDKPLSIPEADRGHAKRVLATGRYRTFLYKAADREHEVGFTCLLLERVSSAVVLVPEIRDAEAVYSALSGMLERDVAIYHSGLKGSEKAEVLHGIHEGRYGIVVGTRSAVFAPLHNPSMIIVLREHSSAYKQEESPRINVRDAAVMRGYLENIPVVLASVTPSSESYLNAIRKKYTMIGSAEGIRRPEVIIVSHKETRDKRPLSRDTARRLRNLSDNEQVLAIIHRTGYSLLVCQECDSMIECEGCGKPLVVYRKGPEPYMQCHDCGQKYPLFSECPHCGGYRLGFFGAGIERIEEELKKIVARKVVRVEMPEIRPDQDTEEKPLILGTYNTRRLDVRDISLIAFLNPDASLNRFEVKAVERFVQDLFYFRDFLGDNGRFLIQTSIPWHRVYRYVKGWDYDGFILDELKRRRQHHLYPYTRSVRIEISSSSIISEDVVERVMDFTVQSLTLDYQYDEEGNLKGFSLLLRGRDSRSLKDRLSRLLKLCRREGLKARIDIDPVFL